MEMFGKTHGFDDATKRHVDALIDEETYKNGVLNASVKGLGGKVGDQAVLYDFKDLKDEKIQNNANTAIHEFLK